MEGTTRIILGGKLGALFGREWNLDISSPAEAIRAINANTQGKFKAYLSGEGAQKYYKIGLQSPDNLIGREEVQNRSGRCAVYILPTLQGSGGGIGKILAGVALIALAFVPGVNLAVAGFIGQGVTAGMIATTFIGLGASMILGGVVQLLTPTPNFNQANSNSDAATRGGNTFQGNAAAVAQGGAVSLIYGRVLVSPMPIMVSFNHGDQLIANDQPVTDIDVVNNPGGIVEYIES